MSDAFAAETISAVDSAEDIRQLRDERVSRLATNQGGKSEHQMFHSERDLYRKG